MRPIAVVSSGMATPVGLTAPAACAAMRADINGFVETRFMGGGGEWIAGCPVPLDPPVRGFEKLVRLASEAISECLVAAAPHRPEEIPLLLCLAEETRPARQAGLDEELLPAIEAGLKIRFDDRSKIFPGGRVAGACAMREAEALVYDGGASFCIVAGVDSLLLRDTIAEFERRDRILTADNSNGFIPGEAGAAVLVGASSNRRETDLRCVGIGFGREKAVVEAEEPLRADGMVEAMRAALADAGRTWEDVDYRIADVSGEQYGFKEGTLAIARCVRRVKSVFDLQHPADSVGETGAAIGPMILGVALAAARKGYAPGPGVLAHFSNDDGKRAAMILRYDEGRGA